VSSEPSATSHRFRLPWSPRTLLILVPLHLVAFLLLYVAVLHLVVHEVAMTYEAESGALLNAAVSKIHSSMVCSQGGGLHERLGDLMVSHEILGLSVFNASGHPGSPVRPPNPRVSAFLATDADENVRIDKNGGKTTLIAMARIRATSECKPCHIPGATIGALMVTRDISDALSATRRRTGIGLALLIGGWAGLVVVVNFATKRFATASVDALKARVAAEPPSAAPTTGVRLGMDSLSHELYRSLESTLREHRKERAAMESRFENAERLASMGQLAAGLAHEIKNPVAGVQGALELLVEECHNDDRIDLYQRMLDELRRVNETLHSLLHFARPRKPQRLSTDIPLLLKDIADLARPGLSRRGITLSIRVDERVRTFILDPGQIRQVVVNLITNAADAIGSSGSIKLLATPFPEGNGMILAVVDDGHGMDEETLKAVFEPFFTTKLHGTGLGLAVAQKIVEKHGGSIQITSAPGEGTTVFLLFPDPGEEISYSGGTEA